ncbi:MAG TPA: FAD-binding protein [Chitinophagales bacterium]|jgi:uncharacterized FAD-dependent dehydrogenase|nr:FAD-binding protein [Chitinophagales bacterium]MBP6153192.1 FAD-binding protein [Chitinophagales bacterium]HQV78906.1 FAD-binding protein [Chitinophagales bacterium]HQW79272.1 FAD-binding protein [Chitinophagales bacterium]HRB66632.1 FAD-binding protein [Chitinophagales bacterium]
MIKNISLELPPEVAFDEITFHLYIQQYLQLNNVQSFHVQLLKRSIDARSRTIKVNIQATIYIDELPQNIFEFNPIYKNVSHAQQVIIVGAGPAGLFAALRLIELGLKPIILERGKDVQERRRDLANINKKNIVNENSNYCFGEGGAGTYSDGKLYTRSKKRGDIKRILEIMVQHGAPENILFEAHPHIGTNKLPKLIQAIRNTIIKYGGEIHFNTKVIDFIHQKNETKGVVSIATEDVTQKIKEHLGISVLLATGHSARDIFSLLQSKNIQIENKPFALGVRVEHPQQFINSIQYHNNASHLLPSAAYNLVAQIALKTEQKAIFSFCMCPGGFIVPAATSQNEIVVNGMSPSKRDSLYANSGIVVAVDENDWKPHKEYGNLAALEFQKNIEHQAWQQAGKTQAAPAQRLLDFVKDKASFELNETSYQPGLVATDMNTLFPDNIAYTLKEGFKIFGNKMKNYVSNNAQILGIESRTSSPVKIPRDKETLEHITMKRLFPCAEGAGYAGGIMSAAIDGERCAEAIAKKYA